MAAGFGALSDPGAVSTFGADADADVAGVFADFAFVRGFSSDPDVVERFGVFDFDVGTNFTDTGFG